MVVNLVNSMWLDVKVKYFLFISGTTLKDGQSPVTWRKGTVETPVLVKSN